MEQKSQKMQELKREYQNLKEIVSLDLTNWDVRTKSGMEGKQNSSKLRMENLEALMATELLKNSITTLVDRNYDGAKELVDAAKSSPKTDVVLDYLSVEKGMFKAIFGEKATTFTMNSHVINSMNTLMMDVGRQINAEEMPMMYAGSNLYGSLNTRQEMIERMEKVVEAAYGVELKQLFLGSLIKEAALDRVDQDFINILIVNVPKEYATKLGFTSDVRFIDNSESVPTVKGKKSKQSKVE
jgi:hypothetical protein